MPLLKSNYFSYFYPLKTILYPQHENLKAFNTEKLLGEILPHEICSTYGFIYTRVFVHCCELVEVIEPAYILNAFQTTVRIVVNTFWNV